MKTMAGPNSANKDKRGLGASPDTGGFSNAPDTLIRTTGGRVTSWPPGMERRYGYTSEQAVGRVSHELLNTIFPYPLRHIEAALLADNTWSGGVIHHHADGRVVTAMSSWGLHQGGAGTDLVVIETHSSAGSREFADLLAIFANELSQPLTAIGNYVNGARRTLGPRPADQETAREAMTLAGIQVMRGADQVSLMRRLASDLRQIG